MLQAWFPKREYMKWLVAACVTVLSRGVDSAQQRKQPTNHLAHSACMFPVPLVPRGAKELSVSLFQAVELALLNVASSSPPS